MEDEEERRQDTLRRQMLSRLLSKLELAVTREPMDLDYMEFTCRQELYLCNALSHHLDVPTEILRALQELFRLVMEHIEWTIGRNMQVGTGAGETGRPRLDIEREGLEELLEIYLPVPCISKMLGVSTSTVFRRMQEFGFSARRYSLMMDEELDSVVQNIKNEMPTAGYRMVKGRLWSLGIHVQWRRVAASMHRVDSMGILSRLAGLGCILRRTYSVRGPLSLWHVDTNHKLIRIECLWRDVKTCVISKYYNILQSLERDQLLDLSSTEDLFTVHTVFLPKLKKDLQNFVEGWNNHPIRTENNMTPDQLWSLSLRHSNISQPENVEEMEEPDIDWDIARNHDGELEGEIVVPQLESPLSEEQRLRVQSLIEQSDPDMPVRDLYLTCREYITGTGL
ncbi:hypothetical protein MHYP_G00360930 [Metynnis hypsauchen]